MPVLDDPFEILLLMRGGWRLQKSPTVRGKWRLVKDARYRLVNHDTVYEMAGRGQIVSDGPDRFVLKEE